MLSSSRLRSAGGSSGDSRCRATGTLVYEPTTDDSGADARSAVLWVDRKGEVAELQH
jgi:hypothetical protein